MKLTRVFHGRNLMLIYFTMSILLSLTMVNIPVKSDPETRLYIRESPPGSWKTGEPVNNTFFLTVDIESPIAWDDTSTGIVGWAFSVHVDPNVLEPINAYGANFDYFLYDYIDWNGYVGHDPILGVDKINPTAGDMINVSEIISGFEPLGKGAGGSSGT
ncbi:MAG: hypothetical protein GWO08_06780, partial [Gammaproteobacteria bacterium]|nr:hypothetical protein [Phycisphaerae bacterium]NIR93374.1 hypothetical protein [Gammaproteobacteria bacterium]